MKKNKKITRSLEWFEERINKLIFRCDSKGRCMCQSCTRTINHGLKIHDKRHAHYIFDIQREFGFEYGDEPFDYPQSKIKNHDDN